MTERKKIKEEDKVHEDWYEEAKPLTLETLPEFLRKLSEDYEHDYGTICHALAAGAIGTMWALNKTEQGGITGFQASCIMWSFIAKWMHYEEPLRLVKFGEMLYPQYDHHFDPTITESTWKWLQEQAKKNLEKGGGSDNVKKHWQSIVDGRVPFGYRVKD